MERFLKLLYYYCLGAFVVCVVYLTIMLFISPRQDALKRGFIPCTEQLVVDISECERGKIVCPLKHLWQDMQCNVKVVFGGFGAWIKGSQKTPWENYLFVPKAVAETDEELPYEGSVIKDMDDLETRRLFIEKKQSELEAAKNRQLNLNEEVLISNPEQEILTSEEELVKEVVIKEEAPADISDEAFIEEKWEETSDAGKEKVQPQRDTIKQIVKKTSEQLNKEEMKDER